MKYASIKGIKNYLDRQDETTRLRVIVELLPNGYVLSTPARERTIQDMVLILDVIQGRPIPSQTNGRKGAVGCRS